MPTGDDVTGLHAFDDLDQVSTVSALNVVPDRPLAQPAPGPRLPSAPPPTPPAARASAPPVPAPKARSMPPAPPPGRAPSLPPPPVRGAGGSVPPPPPRGGNAGLSVPAPPPASQPAPSRPAATAADGDGPLDGDTKVVPYDYADDTDATSVAGVATAGDGDAQTARFESFDVSDDEDADEPKDEITRAAAVAAPAEITTVATVPEDGDTGSGIDDTALLELSATTSASTAVATSINMEWDDDEVQTKLRDEVAPVLAEPPRAPLKIAGVAHQSQPAVVGKSSPSGNPSPFASARPTLRPIVASTPAPGFVPPPRAAGAWEDDDDALTRVKPAVSVAPRTSGSVWDSALVGRSAPPPPIAQGLAEEDLRQRPRKDRLALYGLVAAALLGLGLAARALMAPPDPGTITLVTQPVDAEVTVDGRSLAGQTSPFTVQGLVPGTEHVVNVTRVGFAAQTQRFTIDAGEVKALPTLDLVPLHVDTGFALASDPAGAAIYVDGRKLEQVTPARITDLAQGLHLIRLEGAGGLQPWETQVALATGQVIELPTARLVQAQVAQQAEPAPIPVSVAVAPKPKQPSRHRVSAPRARQSTRQPLPQAAPSPVAYASASGGAGGTLRVNSRPWAQIFVDGRMMGNTPQLGMALPAGKHDVKLVNPLLGMSRKFSVRIQSGKIETKIVELIN